MDDTLTKENGKIQSVHIDVPQSLMSRVHGYCDKHDLTVQEFIRDALSEKLIMAHKERRRKPRV